MSKKRSSKNRGIALIKKSNELIEARYKFDVWETRFFLALLSHIRREDADLQPYRIWYRDLIKTFGLKSNQSYSLLREAASSLMQKTFKVSLVAESGIKREKEYHIVRTVEYMAEGEEQKTGAENEEFIDVTFEPEMKPLLLQLQKNFTAYDLRNVAKLGTYPVRIYELLKQYETIGHRTLTFEEFKRMFELENEYELFANFYQRIIKPSLSDINEHTDLTITNIEKIKEGKKIVALRFDFVRKSDSDLRRVRGEESDEPAPSPNPAQETKLDGGAQTRLSAPNPAAAEKDRLATLFFDEVVKKFGVTPSVFLGLLENQTEESVHQAIRVTRRAKLNNQIKTNLAGFFVHALKSGYTDTKEEENRKKAEKAAQQAQAAALSEQEEARSAAINDRIRQMTNDDPGITEKAIESLYRNPLTQPLIEKNEAALQRPLVVEDFRQDQLLREMVKLVIVEMNKENFEDIFEEFGGRVG